MPIEGLLTEMLQQYQKKEERLFAIFIRCRLSPMHLSFLGGVLRICLDFGNHKQKKKKHLWRVLSGLSLSLFYFTLSFNILEIIFAQLCSIWVSETAFSARKINTHPVISTSAAPTCSGKTTGLS